MNDTERERLMVLFASLVDETIGDDEKLELNGLLDGNRHNQLLYKRYLELHCCLGMTSAPDGPSRGRAVAQNLILSPQVEKPTYEHTAARSLFPRREKLIAAVVGGLAVAVGWLLLVDFGSSDSVLEAALGKFEGEVVVTGADGETIPVSLGIDVLPGCTIETRGSDSFATLEFSDQTRFVLVNDSVARIADSNVKNLDLRNGRLVARVESQPAGDPFRISAPHANVHVLGTQFVLEARREQTDVNVIKGRVAVTDAADENSVEISQGEYVVARDDSPFVVQKTSTDKAGWSEDFEYGLPEHWQSGTFEPNGLPAGSKGGVRAAKRDGQVPVVYELVSQDEWSRGLFAYRDDLHLHVTFKMDQPSWINVFFIARTNDAQNLKTFLYKFDKFPIGKAGEWCKVTIPLSQFQLKTSKGFEDIPATEDELVFGMNLSSPSPDRRLVIDELSVKRGGPGKVVFERLK